MSINTKESYCVIGTDENLSNALLLPAPTQLPFSNEFMAEAERTSSGVMIIEEIGRTQYTTEIKWSTLPNKTWWKINRWFETYGYVFYMQYFNHATGMIKTQSFYRGNVTKATPSTVTELMNGVIVPKTYKDCGFNVIDMGEDDIIVHQEMSVN